MVRRRLIMDDGNRLHGYQELEYIEFHGNGRSRDYDQTGSGCVVTGVSPFTTPNLVWELDAQFLSIPTIQGYYNGCYDTGNTRFDIAVYSSGYFLLNVGTDRRFSEYGRADTLRHSFWLDAGNSRAKIDDMNWVTVGTLASSSLPEIILSVAIGARKVTSVEPTESCSNERVYGSKLWSGDTLIMELVPAKKISTGEPGMYDLVNDRFLAVTGTAYEPA